MEGSYTTCCANWQRKYCMAKGLANYTIGLFKLKFVSLRFSRGFDVFARTLPIEKRRRGLRLEATHTF